MLCKNWIVSKLDKDKVSDISEKFGIPPFLSIMLQVRGIDNDKKISEFLSDERSLVDPMTFIDMDKAIDRILTAIDKFERICIYGDYDADGVTATVLLYSYLSSRGANVIYFIPNRYVDGYGLNSDSIEKLKNQGVDLIITVDNGISAFNEIKYAMSIGIDVVVTDHHKVPEVIPNAIAVVNPHRNDCKSEFKEFSGVGVAFKLVCALEGKDNENEQINDLIMEYGDLVAIGTIGDVVPLCGENRTLVKYGLEMLNKGGRLGIKYLLDLSGISDRTLNSTDIAFSIVPRINASGRIKNADIAAKLLLSGVDEEASQIASDLNQLNLERKRIETDILKQIDSFLEENPFRLFSKVIVVEGDSLHPGVIGIVASRLVEKYCKPCIVISKDEKISRGSGRSVEGFSLYDATNQCSEYLIKFGGHPMAVGFDIPSNKIEKLVVDVNKFANELHSIIQLNLNLDCKLKPESLSVDFVNQLEILEPFGCGNSSPLFGLFDMKIEKIQGVSGGKHQRITLIRDEVRLTAMKFSTTANDLGFIEGDTVDIAVTLTKDFFRGVEKLSIFIRDIKPSGNFRKEIISNAELYEKLKRSEDVGVEQINLITPNRNDISIVYKFLKSNNGWNKSLETLWLRLEEHGLSACKLELILDIMNELRLIDLKKNPNKYLILIKNVENKVSLDSSNILKELKLMGVE